MKNYWLVSWRKNAQYAYSIIYFENLVIYIWLKYFGFNFLQAMFKSNRGTVSGYFLAGRFMTWLPVSEAGRKINREYRYYMAAQDTKFLFEECISPVSTANEWNTFQYEKRNFVSSSGHVIFCVSYKHQWNNEPFNFCCKGTIYCVTVAMRSFHIYSCDKISCFCMKNFDITY